MPDENEGTEHDEMKRTKNLGEALGADGDTSQDARNAGDNGGLARHAGASQNSGGALQSNADEDPDDPGRGAD